MRAGTGELGGDVIAYLEAQGRKDLLRFITCGSVDDGKSTLIGRLLYESHMLFDDQLAALQNDSKKLGTQDGEDQVAVKRAEGIEGAVPGSLAQRGGAELGDMAVGGGGVLDMAKSPQVVLVGAALYLDEAVEEGHRLGQGEEALDPSPVPPAHEAADAGGLSLSFPGILAGVREEA